MKLLIVDDEALARARMRRLLEPMPEWEIIGEASNGREALNIIEQNTPDIVLMDIRMPDIDGLEAAHHLANTATVDKRPAVIFTTAYGDYAIEAFDAQAIDYLLKPVTTERLTTALQRAKTLTSTQLQAVRTAPSTDLPSARKNIAVRRPRGLLLVAVEDIHFFHAEHKYVTLYHNNGEELISESLITLETEFGSRFIRIHRNAIVSRDYLIGMERAPSGQLHAILRNSTQRPEISRRYATNVRKILQGDHE